MTHWHPLGLTRAPFTQTESNESFDASLRSQNPAWGYRDVSEMEEAGLAVGMQLARTEPMPANNFVLVFTPRK